MKFLKIILLLTFLISSMSYSLTCPPTEIIKQFIETKGIKALSDTFNYEHISYQLYDASSHPELSKVNLEYLLKTNFKILGQDFISVKTNQDGSTLFCSYIYSFYNITHPRFLESKMINLISSNINKKHGGFINPNTDWRPIKCEDIPLGYCKDTPWAKDTVFICYSDLDIPEDEFLKKCAFTLGASIKKQ